MSTTMGSGSAFPEEAGITAKWIARRRPFGRSGFSSTDSAPHRAGELTPASRQELVGNSGGAAANAVPACDPRGATDIRNKTPHDVDFRVMKIPRSVTCNL